MIPRRVWLSRSAWGFVASLVRTSDAAEQKLMANSSMQARNVAGTLTTIEKIPAGGVLLIDDIVDSGWTLTLAGWLLRKCKKITSRVHRVLWNEMYGRASLPARPDESSFCRRIEHWRKEGRARRPARTLRFSIPLKPGSYSFTSPKRQRWPDGSIAELESFLVRR